MAGEAKVVVRARHNELLAADDHLGVLVELLGAFQDLLAVRAGHADVGDDDVRRASGEGGLERFRIFEAADPDIGLLKGALQDPSYGVVVVDEAHLLASELLDQLRFLLNDEMDSASLISLVLLGQPDLAHKLRFAPYEALHQRIAVRYHLRPFDLEETAGYIKHHMRVAGYQGQLFSDSFLSGVHDHTKGVARKINNVCRNALLLGATERKQVLDQDDLKRVLLDLEGQIT